MRLINLLFIALIAFALMSVGYVYMRNTAVLGLDVMLWSDASVRVSSLLIGAFLLGFVLNILYTGIMELSRFVKGINASAATRAGKRLSSLLHEARELLAHGLPGHARQVLESVIRERADHEAANLLLAEALMKLGEYDTAVKHLEAWCLTHPDDVEFHYLLADALVADRNPDGATSLLKRLAGDHPKQGLRALRKLRTLHMDAGRWEEALDVHKRLVSRFVKEVNAQERAQGTALLYQVAMNKIEADQFREAVPILQQILKEDTDFVPAYLSLGRCMILQDQEPQGIEIWLEGFRTTGEGALLQELEDFYIQSGKPDEGLGVLRRVAATSEFTTTAKFFLGKMLYRLEILDEALVLFQEVRTQVVYSPILFFFMAKIHARRGRNEQALNEYRQLLRNLGILRQRFECSVCGQKTPDYVDRCEACGSWNASHFMFKENELPDMGLRQETGPWV
ncbi:tetratricopeptide repeat protein [Mesoterricola sediminis]|uniref:Tetratricopeptide repeat domain protein n=1 Tax=Mesoterricola sediminis TaxID=2927980 RepID=A0AA48GPE6_9BACT|nr:tetratricopeptide repeat protein [Mesoterricola sediminis]BDU75114.1 tetratricopeptide repeat domain protein [Mesoterricola sediminis]